MKVRFSLIVALSILYCLQTSICEASWNPSDFQGKEEAVIDPNRFELTVDPIANVIQLRNPRSSGNSSFVMVSAVCTDCPAPCPEDGLGRTIQVTLRAIAPVAAGWGVSGLTGVMYTPASSVTSPLGPPFEGDGLLVNDEVTVEIDGNVIDCNHWFKVFFDVCEIGPAASTDPCVCHGSLMDLEGTDTCVEVDSLTAGWITGLNSWTHTYPAVPLPITRAWVTMDIGDADSRSLDLNVGGTFVGRLTGGDNGGPGTWRCPDAWVGGADLTFNIPTTLFADLADGSVNLSTSNDTGVTWWGSNRALIGIEYGGFVDVVGTETCTEALSLSGGFISTDVSWTHSYAPVAAATITSAKLTVDVGDADGAPVEVRAGGTSLGFIGTGDNGGPGAWKCPGAWLGSEPQDFVLDIPASLYSDIADGTFDVTMVHNPGAGLIGMNRAVLSVQLGCP